MPGLLGGCVNVISHKRNDSKISGRLGVSIVLDI